MAGIVGKILSFVRVTRDSGANVADVEVDPGGGDHVTAEHAQPPNVDARPLPDDFAVSLPVRGSRRYAVVGYFDTAHAGEAAPGEYRVYARDDSGTVVVDLHLKNDGSVEVQNDSGGFSLETDGTIVLNGVTIDPSGLITTPTGIVTPSAIVNGKELAEHTHPAGTEPGSTGPNN